MLVQSGVSLFPTLISVTQVLVLIDELVTLIFLASVLLVMTVCFGWGVLILGLMFVGFGILFESVAPWLIGVRLFGSNMVCHVIGLILG